MFTNKPCKQAVSKELAEACVDITRCSEDPLSSPGSIPVEQTQSNRKIPPKYLEGPSDIILSVLLHLVGVCGKCLQLRRMA